MIRVIFLLYGRGRSSLGVSVRVGSDWFSYRVIEIKARSTGLSAHASLTALSFTLFYVIDCAGWQRPRAV